MTEPTADGGAGTETPPPSTPAEERAKRRWWVWLILVLLLLVLLVWLLAYCVNQDSKKDTSDGATPTPTAVVTTGSSGSSPTASPTPTASPSSESPSPSPTPTPTVATAQVPNVVGKDATTATSTLTTTGFTKVTCVDAEGATVPASDTLVVTKQDPAAGQTVPVDTEIKLTCAPKSNGRG